MCSVFLVRLDELQPSQLYINSEKLAAVLSTLDAGGPAVLEPLPVKKFGDRVVLTDGHTRAVAAHLAGLTEMPALWDRDELDWDAYRLCITWCQAEGVRTVSDLAGRIVASEDYERLWLRRCAMMHQSLAARRAGKNDER